MGGSCNLLEIVSVDIDVPENLEYAPVLTVYIYDNYLGILGSRLLGVTNIPLSKYCEQILEKKYESNKSYAKKPTLKPEDIKLSIQEEFKENGLI